MASKDNSTTTVFKLLPPETILEGLFPGYNVFTRFVSLYFHIDATFYLVAFATFLAFWTYVVPSIWSRLQFLFIHFASTIEIRYHDDLYNDAIRWISCHVALNKSRQLVAGTKLNFPMLWADEEDDDVDISEDQLHFEDDSRDFWVKRKYLDNLHAIRFTPAPAGVHYFMYKGCWLGLQRQPYRNVNSPWVANMETLFFFAAPWRQPILKGLLREIQETSAERDLDRIKVYRGLKSAGSGFHWMHAASKRPRPLSTIVLNQEQKQAIIDDIHDYLHPRTRQWYLSRGLPYRRGYLFYGLPGTGKSSLCLGIASLIRLNIYMLSLSANGLDDNSLATLFQSLPRRCIVLFEDVDEAGICRPRSTIPPQSDEGSDEGRRLLENSDGAERQPKGITLSAFLNVIDGVAAQEGRILVMTTNHVEQLDSALRRPGRVDMQIKFSAVDHFSAQEHFLAFYLEPPNTLSMGIRDPAGAIHPVSAPTSSKWKVGDITTLAQEFADGIPSGKYTAAELQNYLLQYRNDPESAARGVTEWVDRTSELDMGNMAHDD